MFRKLLIYGESWVGCHGQLLRDDLLDKGNNVEIFDHTKLLPGILNRSLLQRLQRRIFIRYYEYKIRKRFWEKIEEFKPSCILICKGLNLDRKLLRKIRNSGYFIINWNPDDFLNPLNSNKELIKSIPYYDLIISSRPHLFPEYSKYGAKDLLYLDWYFVEKLHKKRDLNVKYGVSFVGSWSKKREELIQCLPHKVNVWGGGWYKAKNAFHLENNVHFKVLTQDEMSKVFEQSKFNLNFLTSENRDYTNLRFFEVPASNGLLVTERNDHAEAILTDGLDCIMFSSPEELVHRLNTPTDYALLTSNGYKSIVGSKHEFSNRVNSIIEYLEN